MGDSTYCSKCDCGRESKGIKASRGRYSLDSTARIISNNGLGTSSPLAGSSSLSDIASASSFSSCQSSSRDTTTSRMRFELRHGRHHHSNESSEYLTPLQRREKEIKTLRKELSLLLHEKEEKDAEILSFRTSLEGMREEIKREREKESAELSQRLRLCERERFEEAEEVCKLQEELARMDERYTELKRQISEKEERFEDYLQEMYQKGHSAAVFERDQELEMLATSQKSRVSVRELTRKLSKTELELAKWQGIKLEESYFHTGQPGTQAEATLSFLKDAFFHFLTDKADSEDHLRAMIKIFNYSEVQTTKIRKGLAEFKHLNRTRILFK